MRARLMALVLAAAVAFVFLIGMVAGQHRFNERAKAEQTANDPGMSFIQKPFSAENLAMPVRKVLDAT